jgi:hypothetical protein
VPTAKGPWRPARTSHRSKPPAAKRCPQAKVMTALPLMAEVAGLDVTPRPPTASHRAHCAPARHAKNELAQSRIGGPEALNSEDGCAWPPATGGFHHARELLRPRIELNTSTLRAAVSHGHSSPAVHVPNAYAALAPGSHEGRTRPCRSIMTTPGRWVDEASKHAGRRPSSGRRFQPMLELERFWPRMRRPSLESS